MNLPLLKERACCLFRCFLEGRSVAVYGDASECYCIRVIILIDRNIHCLLWTARAVAFVQTRTTSVPMETAAIEKQSCKILVRISRNIEGTRSWLK